MSRSSFLLHSSSCLFSKDPESVAAQITSLCNISDTVKHLTLQVDPEIIKQKKLSFKAGQWLDLFLPGVHQEEMTTGNWINH